MKEYDGWVIKYSFGRISLNSFHIYKKDVVKWWNKDACVPSLLWKNMSRKHGHKIVKVKLMEIRKAEDA